MRNVMIFIVSLFLVTSAQAMMAAKQPEPEQVAPQHARYPHGGKVYLLSFDGKYLRTTSGTLYAPAVEIVNHGEVDLRKVKDTDQVEVRFTVVDRVVRQVDIYP